MVMHKTFVHSCSPIPDFATNLRCFFRVAEPSSHYYRFDLKNLFFTIFLVDPSNEKYITSTYKSCNGLGNVVSAF